ncbi:lipopolysaccharide biosynthesis protein [Accumulibacter sp.]|uniref:lipopolysaccharide biosynthesis protein n=1 Tax=Accumulibacter sp. TaxID=2053492 RepID=UPI0025E37DC6|nr:lipopolysaccharide biosynthesis protein [Accumulibacter sp.]MCM8626411.1 lipopolysaccharide biosynthesis protein [Accumulibacter sp.]
MLWECPQTTGDILLTTVRRSLAYSIADSYVALPLQLIGTMIISRLLTPQEAGVFAVAAVFAAFASTFRDFGVAEYLIQETELGPEHIRAAFTVNIAVSWVMGLLLFVGSPFAAEFYRDPGVGEVMRVQAVNFLLIPFGAVTMAYFRRQLDFRPIFLAGLLTNLTTFTVSTLGALNGLSYMSLAWSSLAGVVVTVATSLWFRPPGFPRWPGLRGVGRVVQFGKFASGIYVFGQLGKGAPEMIIGRAEDMAAVAMFSRASGLVELFNRTVLRAVTPVCLPYFAKSNRETGSLISGYLTSVSYLTAIGWTFLGFVGIAAYSAVRIFYGPQWTESAPLAQVLCVVGAVELVHYLAKEALVAVGEIKRSNLLQIGIQTSRIAGLLAVVPFGLVGACWGLLGASVFGLFLSQSFLSRALGLHARDVLRSCLPSLCVALFSTAPLACWAVVERIAEDNFVRFAVVGGGIVPVLWLLALRAARHPLWSEILELSGKVAGVLRSRGN